MSERHKYLMAGVLVGAGIMFLLGMSGVTAPVQSETAQKAPVGSYQLAAGSGFYVVLDTRTGRIVSEKGEIAFPKAILASDFPSELSVNLSGSVNVYGAMGIGNAKSFEPLKIETR